MIHPKYYYFSEKGLYESKEQMKKGSNNFEFKVSNDKKYFEYFYIDSVFGKVSNNKSVCNKLDDPELRERKKEIPEILKETPEILIKNAVLSEDKLCLE